MDQGWRAVRPDDEVRRLAEDVAAAAVAPVVVGDQAEVLEDLEVEIHRYAAADLGGTGERGARLGVGDFVGDQDAGDFGVEPAGGIDGELCQDIRHESSGADYARSVVDLAAEHRALRRARGRGGRDGRGKRGPAAAVSAADVRF